VVSELTAKVVWLKPMPAFFASPSAIRRDQRVAHGIAVGNDDKKEEQRRRRGTGCSTEYVSRIVGNAVFL
jgi:hypothetical protein